MSAEIPERWQPAYNKATALIQGPPSQPIRNANPQMKAALEELGTAEAALQAMTIDRDLWRDAHDEDCPNQAMLESTEAALSQAQERISQLQTTVGQLVRALNHCGGYLMTALPTNQPEWLAGIPDIIAEADAAIDGANS